MMGEIVSIPGKELTRASAKGGVVLINAAVKPFAQALAVADRCRRQVQQRSSDGVEAFPSFPYLGLLRDFAEAHVAYNALLGIGGGPYIPNDQITQPAALKMLSVLFGAMGKRKTSETDEDPVMKLLSCADMFDATSNIIGDAAGLWEPVSQHPLVLALAIKHLLATKVFCPEQAEVREAMKKVHQRLSMLAGWTGRWLEKVYQADALLFERDRAAWDATYANVAGNVVLAMRERVELMGGGPDDECDDAGNPWQPSPRWQALNDLIEAKQSKHSTARP